MMYNLLMTMRYQVVTATMKSRNLLLPMRKKITKEKQQTETKREESSQNSLTKWSTTKRVTVRAIIRVMMRTKRREKIIIKQ